MTIPEQQQNVVNHFRESSTLDGIREWRESIETFFNGDWQRVGNIISKLEKSIWDTAASSRTQEATECTNTGYTNTEHADLDCKTQIDAMRNHPVPVSSVPVSSDPQQKQRLENLAKKIEERLSLSAQASDSNSSL